MLGIVFYNVDSLLYKCVVPTSEAYSITCCLVDFVLWFGFYLFVVCVEVGFFI